MTGKRHFFKTPLEKTAAFFDQTFSTNVLLSFVKLFTQDTPAPG